MKKTFLAIAATIATAGFGVIPASAVSLKGNAGLVSDYVFRGADVSDGKAAAQAGLDITAGAFYAGTWLSSVEVANTVEAINVDTGLPEAVKTQEDSGIEIDVYGGLSGQTGDFSWGVGAIYYAYTDNVIDPFIEANLSAGWKWFSLSVNPGKFLTDARINRIKNDQEYVFYSLTAKKNGFYGTLGYWDWDEINGIPADQEIRSAGYFEAGYGDTLTVDNVDLFNYKISYVYAERDLLVNDQSKNTLIFGITKNFSILQ